MNKQIARAIARRERTEKSKDGTMKLWKKGIAELGGMTVEDLDKLLESEPFIRELLHTALADAIAENMQAVVNHIMARARLSTDIRYQRLFLELCGFQSGKQEEPGSV